MSDDLFVRVYDWMFDILKGNDLVVFALIFSLGEITGQKYISDRTRIPVSNVSRSVRRLEKMGLISVESPSRIKPSILRVDEMRIHNLRIHKSSSPDLTNRQLGICQNVNSGYDESSSPFIYNTNSYTNSYTNNNTNKGNRLDVDTLFDDFSLSPDDNLRDSILAFIEHRKKIKKPMTQRALKLNFKEAFKLADGDTQTMTRIFDQSVSRGWAGVFALKEGGNNDRTDDKDFFK